MRQPMRGLILIKNEYEQAFKMYQKYTLKMFENSKFKPVEVKNGPIGPLVFTQYNDFLY